MSCNSWQLIGVLSCSMVGLGLLIGWVLGMITLKAQYLLIPFVFLGIAILCHYMTTRVCIF